MHPLLRRLHHSAAHHGGPALLCASCSVGSACEHQGIHRAATVRRFDTNYDRFRRVVRHSDPYETDRAET